MAPAELRELRRVLRYRNHIVRTAVKEKNKISSPDDGRKLGIPNAQYLPEVSESSRKIFGDLSWIWQVGFEKDGKPRFGAFADAETLIGFKFRKKSRDLSQARSGDLIVFQKNLESDDPYHLMIFVEERPSYWLLPLLLRSSFFSGPGRGCPVPP